MTVVSIIWLDSGMHLDHGWADLSKYAETASFEKMTVQTVGLLMYEDDDVVLVGQTYDPTNDKWIGGQVIVRRNIISLEKLT